jgi:hypothetical protein
MAHYNAERKEEKGVYCLISAKKKRQGIQIFTSSGSFLSFDFINLKRCFWFMHAE